MDIMNIKMESRTITTAVKLHVNIHNKRLAFIVTIFMGFVGHLFGSEGGREGCIAKHITGE